MTNEEEKKNGMNEQSVSLGMDVWEGETRNVRNRQRGKEKKNTDPI